MEDAFNNHLYLTERVAGSIIALKEERKQLVGGVGETLGFGEGPNSRTERERKQDP